VSNLVIVAIPDENDRVWKVSSEQVPHLTILYLGDMDQIPNVNQIVDFVEHAAKTTLNRFYMTVDRRGELGEDQADVLFFKRNYDYKAVRNFRAALLQDHNIRTAYDSGEQFDGPWNPHLTLGYPETPAKEDDKDWGGFYSVDFNKIAVWTGDYEGPEFMLKDYWDEYETLEAIPMDVAMSDIQHFGVKGMRWGVRKERESGGGGGATRTAAKGAQAVGRGAKKAAKGTVTVAKDINFEARTSTTNLKGEKKVATAAHMITQAAHKEWKATDLPALKERHPNASFKNRLTKPLSKDARAYRKDAKETYIKRLETTANSMKNASGTREYTIRERGGDLPTSKYFWEVSSRQARHADGDEDVVVLEVVMDEDGYITGLKQVKSEDTMAQTAVLGASFLAHMGLMEDDDILEHYGVKGMKWGVRKETDARGVPKGEKKREGVQRYLDPQGHALSDDVVKIAVGTLVPVVAPLTWPAQIRLTRGAYRAGKAKGIAIQEKRFAKNAMSPKNFVAIHNKATERVNRDIDGINSKYSDADLAKPASRKKYDDEVLNLMQSSYREAANSIGNRAGTQHLDVEFHNDGMDFKIHAREGAPTPIPHRVKHAAEDDLANAEITVEITGKIKRDAAGRIIGLELDGFEPEPVAHSFVDVGAVLVSALFEGNLEHYGVKGMRWGVRKHSPVETTAVTDTGIVRRRTRVLAEGGASHPAHHDAVKAAVQKQVLKKSGTDALSTQELRELANRLQVEAQVHQLTSNKGRQFVQKSLEEEGKSQIQRGVRTGVRKGARKARRGAALAGTIGVLAV